jgi:hypothetical protein
LAAEVLVPRTTVKIGMATAVRNRSRLFIAAHDEDLDCGSLMPCTRTATRF